jgi:hypothetical protein
LSNHFSSHITGTPSEPSANVTSHQGIVAEGGNT